MYMNKVNEIKAEMGNRYRQSTEKDLLYGFTWEDKVLKILHNSVNKDIKKYEDNFANFDFYLKSINGDIICDLELKTRRTYKQQYASVPASINKLIRAIENTSNGIDSFFIFNFDNKKDKTKKALYYYKFDNNAKNTEWYIGKIINKKTNDKPKDAIHIKTKYLKSVRYLKSDLP